MCQKCGHREQRGTDLRHGPVGHRGSDGRKNSFSLKQEGINK